jgi:hypothetical protein
MGFCFGEIRMTNPNDPAFPKSVKDQKDTGETYLFHVGGLTKREYFAAMALQGALAGVMSIQPDQNDTARFATSWMQMPKLAVSFADELIEELSK